MTESRRVLILIRQFANTVYFDYYPCSFPPRNGLRDFPTFMINILTVYGNIIVYFKLPDWVNDWEDSLVEKEGDPLDVKALKVRKSQLIE